MDRSASNLRRAIRPIRIGVVSDTHMPQRWPSLPDSVFAAFEGVDLILHAGDVGDPRVLDRLSTVAPVVAVHGNDESPEARALLPYRQIVPAVGRRIMVCHSHSPDPDEERALRRDDAWEPKLARWAAMGRATGAGIVVYGHSHIPMAHRHDGVWLLNPGAIASPNAMTRQLVQSVALLTVLPEGDPSILHLGLHTLEPFDPAIDWGAGFQAAHRRYAASILSPEVAAVEAEIRELARLAPEPVRAAVLRVAHRCWAGERDRITAEALRAALREEAGIPGDLLARFEALLGSGQAE